MPSSRRSYGENIAFDGVGRPKFDFHMWLKREDRMPLERPGGARLRLALRDDVPAHAERIAGLRRGGAADELILIANF